VLSRWPAPAHAHKPRAGEVARHLPSNAVVPRRSRRPPCAATRRGHDAIGAFLHDGAEANRGTGVRRAGLLQPRSARPRSHGCQPISTNSDLPGVL
jgi:hypothetical protein